MTGARMMKAQVLHAIGDLRYEEVPVPQPADGEVLLRVRAAGICGSDVPRICENGAHVMPLIPGHEFSGEMAETGARVGIFPLIPCRKCPQCRQGHYELCRHYDYVGSRRDGAFAEYVSVPAANLIPLPEGVSFEEAAMAEPMAVAVHAMRRGFRTLGIDITDTDAVKDRVREMNVAVIGAGTIGLLLAMFLIDAGVKSLYVTGNKDTQKERALSLGVPEERFVNSREMDAAAWLCDRTNGGADLVFECVGRADTYAMAVDAAAPMGGVILMGNPYGDMMLPRDIYWKLLRNQLTRTGTWNSSFDYPDETGSNGLSGQTAGSVTDDWHYVISRLEAGTVQPALLITHRLPLSELGKGISIMRDKTEDYCKIMVVYER